MPCDIILDDETLRLKGPTFDLDGHTIILDNILKRDGTVNTVEFRRPLVHDGGDTLTINWRQKYTGGVAIFGPVLIPDSMTVKGVLDVPGKLTVNLKDVDATTGIPITKDPDVDRQLRTIFGAGGVLATDPFKHLTSKKSPIDVALEIMILRRLLKSLNERVVALEAR